LATSLFCFWIIPQETSFVISISNLFYLFENYK
jgi:hypothetical protein